MSSTEGLSVGFELLDIEIIDHQKEPVFSKKKWNCDHCSLFFLSKAKLMEHKSRHSLSSEELIKCQYCNKILSLEEESKECLANKKCNTCEYKCTKCPLRFQRNSSLLNHQKTHNLPKRKNNGINKSKPGTTPKSVSCSSNTRKKQTEEQPALTNNKIKIMKRKANESENILLINSSQKKKRIQEQLCQSIKSTTTPNDTTSARTNLKHVVTESSHDNPPLNTSSQDDINYKPFSCHICCDNFASSESLLTHIQSHGESVSKGLKCKHCGEEFGDIYKMQYHLAICPLAEDETSIVKNLPFKFLNKPSVPLRKKGRPRKIKNSVPLLISNGESNESIRMKSDSGNLSPKLLRTRRQKHSQHDNNNLIINEFVDSNCSEIDDSLNEYIEEDPLSSIADVPDKSFEAADEDKSKVHCCPFPRCDMKFSREKALLCHMRNHTDDFEDTYKCHKCGIPFEDILSLRSHINECADIKEEPIDNDSEPDYEDCQSRRKSYYSAEKNKTDFPCNVCGTVYSSQEKLKRCIHNTVPETTIPCRLCCNHFKNEIMLKKHFRSTHSMNLPFQCAVCNAQFDSKAAESEHLQAHLDSDKFQCLICSLKLPSYKDLYFHYKQDHVTKRQNICKICNKVFPNESSLLKHSNFHAGEYRHKCIFCQRTLSSNTSLTVHLKLHTTKKIFKCKICYRPFFDTGELIKHMLLHATMANERPFKCCLCYTATKNKLGLTAHTKRAHFKNTTPNLKCPVCSDILTDAKTLVSHIIDHSIRISNKNMSASEMKWEEKTGPASGVPPMLKKGTLINCFDDLESNSKIKTDDLSPTQKEIVSNHPNYNTRKKYIKFESENTDFIDQLNNLNTTNSKNEDCSSTLMNGELGDITLVKKKKSKKEIKPLENRMDSFNITKDITPGCTSSMKNVTKANSSKDLRINTRNEKNSNRKTLEGQIMFSDKTSQKIGRVSNQRPMSFMKITNTFHKKTLKPFKTSTHDKQMQHSQSSDKSAFPIHTKTMKGEFNEFESGTENSQDLSDIITTTVQSLSEKDELFNDHKIIKEENGDIMTTDLESNADDVEEEEAEKFIVSVKHYEPAHEPTTYDCTTCSQSFSSHEQLYLHNTTHIL